MRTKPFLVAALVAPDECVANLNATVIELQRNNSEAAMNRLERISEGNTIAYNLWGIAFAMQGELESAREWFTRAIQNGCADARHNLEQLEKYITDNI